MKFKGKGNHRPHKMTVEQCSEESESDLSDDFDNHSEAGVDGSAKVNDTQHMVADAKRKASATDLQPPCKVAKLSVAELYKAPTNEELNSLKETETLFHSSLFRMQISELLDEVLLKGKRRREVDEMVHQLQDTLLKLPAQEARALSDQKWVTEKAFSVPLLQKPEVVKGIFRFEAPVSVRVIGSYLFGTAIRPEVHMDLALQLPPACIQPKDFMNQRYLRKRALYLTTVAMLLHGKEAIGKLEFMYHHGNHMKPILVITPSGKLGRRVQVHVHTWVDGWLKLNRFHIHKNNIRTAWYWGGEEQSPHDSCSDPPTPHYNTAVLGDLVMMRHLEVTEEALADADGVKDGIVLLKVWLHQRQLDRGYGGFSGFIMSMLVVHLLHQRTVSRTMSSYQVVRNTLLHLSRVDWSTEGITMATSAIDMHTPTMDDFHGAFDIVFVDPSSYVNLCAAMTRSTFHRVQHEALLSLTNIDTPGLDGFEAMFMKPVPFLAKFDEAFHVSGVDCDPGLCPADELLDRCGDRRAVLTRHLLNLVDKAISCRLRLHAAQLVPPEKWSVTCCPPPPSDTITVGLLLDPDTAGSGVDKGPVADSPQAAAFREFWGEKSELRRFQDGAICEAAVWSCLSVQSRRRIPQSVIKHVLKRHASIQWSRVKYVAAQLDALLERRALVGSAVRYHTGEEQLASVSASYEQLARVLRSLRDLPLAIHSIQGVSPALRYAETFPPLPVVTDPPGSRLRDDQRLVPDCKACCPPLSSAITVQCVLESSGKWPEDAGAVARLRAAFHVQLAHLLSDKHGLLAQAYPDHALVLKGGLVFRVQIGYSREASLLKMVRTAQGMLKMVETEEAIAMETQLVVLPKLSSALHGLQQQHPSYCAAVRLAKRWVAAQLLADCLSEMAIELLTAHLYLQPAPFSTPGSPLVAFQRLLHLVANHDWQLLPIIVNLNHQLTKKDFADLECQFRTDRGVLPAMFIATPWDRVPSAWTRRGPSALVLRRLVLLAQEAGGSLQTQLASPRLDLDCRLIFRPPLEAYNALIHLARRQVARRHLAVDTGRLDDAGQSLAPDQAAGAVCRHMPVVDYDPVQCYLKELREAFDSVALFFYDPLGGSYIAVLWKQPALSPQPFKVSHVNARILDMTSRSEDVMIVPNVVAILEDFSVLGAGLVTRVEELVPST